MRFSCPTSALVSALSIATHALSARSTMPVLEGVLLETCEEGLKLTCSDSSMTIVTSLPATIEEEGAVIMPGRLFGDVVRKLPDAELNASTNDREIMTIRCMGSRTTIAGMAANFFPERPSNEADKFVELPQSLLKEMIQKTSFAISSDESRKILTGGLIEISNGEARMVTIDGFRLAMRVARISESAPELNAVIPGKLMGELAKILSDDDSAMATMMFGHNQLTVDLGNTTVYASLLDGEFIKYGNIIPASFKTSVTVNREQMALSVDRASLMARESKQNLIKFSFSNNMMIITSNAEVGDAYEELPVVMDGDELEIAFNVRYITDVLRVADEEELVMKFTTSVSPCLIDPVEGDAFTYLVLPVRLNA